MAGLTLLSKLLQTAELHYFVNVVLPKFLDRFKYTGPVLINPTLDQEQETCHGFLLRESYSKLPPPYSRECRIYIIHFSDMGQICLAAQDIDGGLNIFHVWLDFVIVLAALAAHGCGFRVYLS